MLLTRVAEANIPRTSSNGTTARSWNNRIAKLVRPVTVLSRFSSDNTWITTAVEDIAKARPITPALIRLYPRRMATPASTAAQSTTCREPRPNTNRRITQSRSNDSSRPIINSSSTTPSRAIGSINAGVLMVTAESHGRCGMSEANPNGPTTMPTSIKPSTGLTRKRWKIGMTTPAAPRTISACLYKEVSSGAVSIRLL